MERADLQQPRDMRLAAGSDHRTGQVDMGAFEAAPVAACLVEDADQVDDHVVTGQCFAEELPVVGIAAMPIQPRQHRQTGRRESPPAEYADRMALADQAGTEGLADEPRPADETNRRLLHAPSIPRRAAAP